MIEILVLQALAYQKRGDLRAALVPLERALTLAEPEGYVRVFVDEGPPMAELLQAAAERGIAPDYIQRHLTDSGIAEAEPRTRQNLIEPLSERELEVLRLLATDSSVNTCRSLRDRASIHDRACVRVPRRIAHVFND